MSERSELAALAIALASLAILVPLGLTDPMGWEIDAVRDAVDAPGLGSTIVMEVGTLGIGLATAALIAAIRMSWRPLAVIAGAVVANWLLVKAIKALIERPRPTELLLQRPIDDLPTDFSFPSGHVAGAAALVGVVLLAGYVRGRLAIAIGAVIVALTGFARMHLGVHWPLDVIGGITVGTMVAAAAVLTIGMLGGTGTSR